jgi:hypothetical protein
MEANVKYAVSQTYIVNGVEIHIHHNPFTKQQYARLVGGPYPAYEFFTTDTFTYYPFPGTPPHTVLADAYTCGHLTQLRLGPTPQPRKVVSYTGLDNAPITSYLDGAKGALLQNAFNDQKIEFRQNWTTGAEPVPLPVVPDPELMTLSVTCTPDIYPPYYLMRQQTWGGIARPIGDAGWDLRQTVFQKHVKKAAATVMLPAPKWWRRGTTLKTSRGLVAVVTDSFNNFYFFKVSDASQNSSFKVDTNMGELSYIPLDKCVVVGQEAYMPPWAARCTDDSLVAMPNAWLSAYTWLTEENVQFMRPLHDLPVAPPDPTVSMPRFAQQGWSSSAPKSAVFQVNQALWNFSADGSKAVAVVGYDRGPQMWQPQRYEEGKYGMRFQPLEPVVTARYCSDSVADIRIPAELQPKFPPELGLYPQNLVTPALVEVNIFADIDEKGTLTASVTLRSSDKDAWYVNADYAYRHPELKALGVNEGDLITGEIRCYLQYPFEWPPNDMLADTYCPLINEEVTTYRVRNGATTLLEIATTTMSTDYTAPLHGVPISSVTVPTCKEGDYGVYPHPPEYVYGGDNEVSPGMWEACHLKPDQYGAHFTYACSHPYVGMVPIYAKPSSSSVQLYTVLAACDLRSLSFIFHTSSYDTKLTRGLLVYHHGVVEYSTPGADTYTRYAQDEWLDTHVLKIYPTTSDIVKYRPYFVDGLGGGRVAEDLRTMGVACYSVAHTGLASGLQGGAVHLSTHPNGSYAICAEGGAEYGVYDKIVYSYLKDGVLCTSTTTHAEAFNKAFNQSRQHSDYGSATATFKYGSLGFSGGWV